MAVTVPTTAEGLRETLTDKTKLKELIDGGQFPEFLTNYVKETNRVDPTVTDQVKEQVDQVWSNFLREHEVDLKDLVKRGGVGAAQAPNTMQTQMRALKGQSYNPGAQGAALDELFTSPSEFFAAIDHRADRNDPELSPKIKQMRNALSSTTPADGGFLIPEVMRAELLREALETAIVRPRARVIPMDSLRVGIPMLDSTSNASTVFGGITAYWTEEAAALINTSPTFARVVLEAKKLTAYTEVPNELREDSAISFDALIAQMFPEALAWFEDAAFLGGTGVGEPLGVLTAANSAMIAAAAEGGQAANTIQWENIVNMYSRMLPAALSRAVWVASIDTFPQLATMALSIGTGGSAVWLGTGGDGAPPISILGRPVVFTEKTNTLGTQGDLSFVDFGHYLIGDRQTMTAMSSPHYKFGNDVTAYRIISRVDGRPWLQSAITPKNSGPTLSPFVQLATRP